MTKAVIPRQGDAGYPAAAALCFCGTGRATSEAPARDMAETSSAAAGRRQRPAHGLHIV